MSALVDLTTRPERDTPQAGSGISNAAAASTDLAEPRDGTWLDEDIRFIGEEGALLLEIVLMTLNATPRRRDHEELFVRRMECVLANALRAHFYRESDRVAYCRGNNDYAGRPRWLSGFGLRSTLALMANAGLVGLAPGQWSGPAPRFGKGYAATYWIEEPLAKLIEYCGASLRTVGKPLPPRSSLIKLRAGESEAKRLLRFDPNDETSGWEADLDSYNRFVDQHDVDIAALTTSLEKKLLEVWNKQLAEFSRQPQLIEPEFFNRHLHRIFNDGTFEHGGRLFGAWYQHVPAWLRRRILIDDCGTIELDYSGMALRILYHLSGIDYREDPYSIAQLEAYATATGRAREYFRMAIKKLVQAMLNNGNDDCHPEMIRLEESFRPKYTRKQVRDMILERHEPICEMFGNGVGKALQRVESDIALEVIVSLKDEGIVALPIHDSFRVTKDHSQRLKEQMIVSYFNRVGFEPIIKDH